MDDASPHVADGARPNTHILYSGNGYHYHVREVRGNRVRLRCRHYNKRCRGTAVVFLRTMELCHKNEHCHPPDHLLFEDMAMRSRLIEQAESAFCGRTPHQLLIEAKTNCRDPELASRFTSRRMHGAMYNARYKSYPAIPNTLVDLGVLLGLPNMRAVSETIDGTDMIFRGVVGNMQQETASVIFISGRMLRFLEEITSIHTDGTFKKRPRVPESAQIFNLVTRYGYTVIGIMRVLMLRRTYRSYLTLLRFIRQIAPNFYPRRIHCDFEKAEIKAMRAVFRNSRIVGCLWHYAVAVSSYARSLGLTELMRNVAAMAIVRCLCSVPLLPRNLIVEGVRQLMREAAASPWAEDFLPLFIYWFEEWLPRLSVLSVFGQPERTNNCSESDNSTLANVLPSNWPNVWRCIGGFVKLEHLAWSDKLAIDRGEFVNGPRRYSSIATDKNVRRYGNMLLDGDITPLRYLHILSWRNVPAVFHGLRMNNDASSESESDEVSD